MIFFSLTPLLRTLVITDTSLRVSAITGVDCNRYTLSPTPLLAVETVQINKKIPLSIDYCKGRRQCFLGTI